MTADHKVIGVVYIVAGHIHKALFLQQRFLQVVKAGDGSSGAFQFLQHVIILILITKEAFQDFVGNGGGAEDKFGFRGSFTDQVSDPGNIRAKFIRF